MVLPLALSAAIWVFAAVVVDAPTTRHASIHMLCINDSTLLAASYCRCCVVLTAFGVLLGGWCVLQVCDCAGVQQQWLDC